MLTAFSAWRWVWINAERLLYILIVIVRIWRRFTPTGNHVEKITMFHKEWLIGAGKKAFNNCNSIHLPAWLSINVYPILLPFLSWWCSWMKRRNKLSDYIRWYVDNCVENVPHCFRMMVGGLPPHKGPVVRKAFLWHNIILGSAYNAFVLILFRYRTRQDGNLIRLQNGRQLSFPESVNP